MPSKLEEAIELMNQALELDSSKHYPEALKMYEIGIEFFLDALHSGFLHLFLPYSSLYKYQWSRISAEVEGELARDAVVSKCQEYCLRAEELRQRINEKAGQPIPHEAVEIQERHLPKAIEILTRARQEDARANSLDALRLYEQGLGHFDVVLGCEYLIIFP